MKDKFIQFLKENGALEKFEAYLKNPNIRFEEYNFKSIEEYLDYNTAYTTYVGAAFLWSKTRESGAWAMLDRKWNELCR